IYGGIDIGDYPYRPPTHRSERVLAVGKLAPGRGFRGLVGALEMLAKSGRAFECRIIGEGPDEPALREQIQRCGLSDKVTILPPMSDDLLLAEVREAAVMVLPSNGSEPPDEAASTLLVQAMAVGTPLIALDPEHATGL